MLPLQLPPAGKQCRSLLLPQLWQASLQARGLLGRASNWGRALGSPSPQRPRPLLPGCLQTSWRSLQRGLGQWEQEVPALIGQQEQQQQGQQGQQGQGLQEQQGCYNCQRQAVQQGQQQGQRALTNGQGCSRRRSCGQLQQPAQVASPHWAAAM